MAKVREICPLGGGECRGRQDAPRGTAKFALSAGANIANPAQERRRARSLPPRFMQWR